MLNKVNIKTHHTTDGNEAFTLLELLLVILVLIILVAMFLPEIQGHVVETRPDASIVSII